MTPWLNRLKDQIDYVIIIYLDTDKAVVCYIETLPMGGYIVGGLQ